MRDLKRSRRVCSVVIARFPGIESIEGIQVIKVLANSRATLAVAGVLLASRLAFGQPPRNILVDLQNRTESAAANATTIDVDEFHGEVPR